MKSYNTFAKFYDELTDNVEYEKRSKYIYDFFKENCANCNSVLDLACGTGGFSNEFAKRGIDVIGVDISEEMLASARQNSAECKTDVLYLCQPAEELDLYGTVDGAVCCLDSLNHITDYSAFCTAISKVSLFLEKDRLFIFDVNTVFKHKYILADNTFVIDRDDVYCIWQNETDSETLETEEKITMSSVVCFGTTSLLNTYYISNAAGYTPASGEYTLGIFSYLSHDDSVVRILSSSLATGALEFDSDRTTYIVAIICIALVPACCAVVCVVTWRKRKYL